MIKKYGSFVAGMAAMLLVASLVGSVFAASSRVEYNQAGISLFGEDKVLAGETCKAPNGQGGTIGHYLCGCCRGQDQLSLHPPDLQTARH